MRTRDPQKKVSNEQKFLMIAGNSPTRLKKHITR